MSDSTEKQCTRCKDTKPLDAFHVKRSEPDGRQKWCKQCISDYGKDRTATRAAARQAATPA